MAELVAESSLARHVRISGSLLWSSHNLCFVATAEGVVVVRFTFASQKALNIEMCCDSIELPTEVIEPDALDRGSLLSQICDSDIKVQRMKLDKVLNPSLRSMGDVLAIRQACWEPAGPNVYPRLAVLAQRLMLYTHADSEWQLSTDISTALSDHLLQQPVTNETDEPDEMYKVHCRHIALFTWTQAFHTSSGKTFCHIILCNSYGHLFAVQLDYEACEKPLVERLALPDVPTANVSSIAWVSAGSEAGYLSIGRMDGTCALVDITLPLSVNSCRELKLEADYRPVALSVQAPASELLFTKHNQAFIYNPNTDEVQSFDISQSKYSLNQVAATSSDVYAATGDAGVVIKNRKTGDIVHSLSEKAHHTTHGVSLSPSGLFLFTVSEPTFPDTYVYLRPVVMRLYKLKNLDDYLRELWLSGDITWDSFLMIGLHISSLPQWIMEAIDDPSGWPLLAIGQLRLVYAIYYCMLDRKHNAVCDEPPNRRIQYDKLKRLLSLNHLRETNPTNSAAQDYIQACEKLFQLSSDNGTLFHLPYNQCQMCSKELVLSSNQTYLCKNGHAVAMCSNTMVPILAAATSRCTQCAAVIAGLEDVPAHLRCLMSSRCAYCSGYLLSDYLL